MCPLRETGVLLAKTQIMQTEPKFMLKQFIDQISKELALSDSLVDQKDGSFVLMLEPNLQISLRENSNSGITLLTTLAPLPVNQTGGFLQSAMSANLFGRDTGGGTLSVDRDEKMLIFSLFLPFPFSYREFRDQLEDFANYAESWRTEASEWPSQGKV